MRAVKSGVRPPRPPQSPIGWADLCELCWDDLPARRPAIARVNDVLMAMRPDHLPKDHER